MATKSFYKNVVIRDRSTCRNLVSALEKAKSQQNVKRARISKEFSTLKKGEIKEFFSNS